MSRTGPAANPAASIRGRPDHLARCRASFPDGEPLVLAQGFLVAPERQTQWRAFLRRGRLVAPPDASVLTEALRRFLLPVIAAAASGAPFDAHWKPGGPWQFRGRGPD